MHHYSISKLSKLLEFLGLEILVEILICKAIRIHHWAEGQFHLSRWLVVRALLAQWWVKTGCKCTFFGQVHMYQVIPLKFVWGAYFQKLSPSLVKLRFCDLTILTSLEDPCHDHDLYLLLIGWNKFKLACLPLVMVGTLALGMQEITTNSTARWVVGQRLGIKSHMCHWKKLSNQNWVSCKCWNNSSKMMTGLTLWHFHRSSIYINPMAQQNSHDSPIVVHQTMPQHFHMICSELHGGNTMEYHPRIVNALNHAYTTPSIFKHFIWPT